MTNLRSTALLAGFICLCLAWAPAPALADSNNLEVKCVDASGSPLQGVTVQIQPLQNAKPKDKKSDKQGVAAFNKLDDGIYRVVGRKEGLAPAFYEFAVLKAGAQQSVSLTFQPGDVQKKLYFEDQGALNQRAFELLQKSIESLKENKPADAEKLLKESIDIYPSYAQAHYYAGITYIQMNKWDEAEAAFKNASHFASIMKELPRPKEAENTPSPYDEIVKMSQAMLAKFPALRLRGAGDAALKEKKFDQAIASYSEALRIDSTDADLYYNLAVAQAHSKKFDDAAQSIQKAMQLRPGEKAFEELNKQIAGFRESEVLSKAQGLLNEGDALMKKDDHAAALQKYQEALPMVQGSKQSIVWAAVARAQAGLNHPNEAVEAYRKAIELDPEKPEYRTGLAQFYMKEKKYDDALNLYADPRTTGNKPADEALFSLGQTLSKQGNSEVAQLAFERAIKANPTHAEAYYELGMLLFYGKTDDKKALETLTKYVEIGKDKAHVDNANSVLVVLKRRMAKK
jgi:tetratricopeptide (TPR) repeat protein